MLEIHTHTDSVSEEAIRSIATPDSTESWHPIPHSLFLNQLKAALPVVDSAFALYRNGERFFGLLELENDEESSLIVGLRNAHDRMFAAGIAIGNRFLTSNNLAFSSEIVISRKHTRNILRDLPDCIQSAIPQIYEIQQKQNQFYQTCKQYPLDEIHVHDFFIRTIDFGVIAPSKLPRVLEDWRKEEDKTLWTAFHSIVNSLRGTTLWDQPRRTTALYNLCAVMIYDNMPHEIEV